MRNRFLPHFCFWFLLASLHLSQIGAQSQTLNASPARQESTESLRGLLLRKQLEPPLRDDIKRVRFSPDGKYILAQDDGGINVLTRTPFAALFRIEASRASEAQFTPDSQSIVFHKTRLRVQLWSVAEQKLKTEQKVNFDGYCTQTSLSPDGKTLACLDFGRNLVLLDVSTGAQILRRDDFFTDPFEGMLVLFPRELFEDESLDRQVNMDFSPDGRYFAAGLRHLRQRNFIDKSRTVADASKPTPVRGYEEDPNDISQGRPIRDVYRPGESAESSKAIAIDLTTRKLVSLGGQLKDIMAGGFTFISPDRVAGVHRQDRTKSALVTFPAGEAIKLLPIEQGQLDAPARGQYVLIRPLKNYPVGVMNLTDGSLLMANKKAALDIYEDVYVSERADGEIGLYGVGKNDLRAKLQLPPSPLTYLEAVALSTDFNLLAISGRTRAAVWDLNKGERLFYLRKFNGAYYAEDGAFHVDFPRQDSVERTTAMLQTQQRQVLPAHPLEAPPNIYIKQHGQFLTLIRTAQLEILPKPTGVLAPIGGPVMSGSSNKNVALEVRDVRTMAALWSKQFPKEAPSVWVDAPNETMILRWEVSAETAKAEIKGDAKLSKRLAALKEKEGDEYLQILNARTGQVRSSFLLEIDKKSFSVRQVLAANDALVIADSLDHIRVYSLTSGEQIARVPGTDAAVTQTSNLLCVKSKDKELAIYDLANMQARDRLSFSSPVAFARFSQDGKRLFVLTENHTAYVLDVSAKS